MTAVSRSLAPSSLRAWLIAARPATLSAAIIPVVVGSAVAAAVDGFALGPAAAALFGAVLIQIGTNFANDVFDHEKGADTTERLGPTRAVAAGLLSAKSVKSGMVIAFALAAMCGVYLVALVGWPVVAIGIASIASGIAYTGGPYPLGYNGLGDVFVMLFFGFVAVCGTTLVQVGSVPTLAWWAALPIGSLATAVLVVNNLRDAPTDAKCGKRTLAVRWGERAACGEYAILILVAYATPVGLAVSGAAHPAILSVFVSFPIALSIMRGVFRDRGPALNQRLRQTAMLLVGFGVPLAAGLAVS